MLFTDESLKPLERAPEPGIESPAGRIKFEVYVNDASMGLKACKAYQFSTDGVLYCWSLGDAEVELLLCPNPTGPGGHSSIDQVDAAFLRVQAKLNCPKVGFAARIAEVSNGFSGGIESGQAFCSVVWRNGPLEVSLGTDDEEGLHFRCGQDLPGRWATLIPEYGSEGTFVTTDNRCHVLVELPTLEPGERCQIGYAVASSNGECETDSGAWQAADLGSHPHREDIKVTPRGWANGST